MIGYIYLFFIILNTSMGQVFLKKHSLSNKQISIYLLIGICLLVSVPLFSYLALYYIKFNIVFLSDALSIAMVIILSSLFLKEKIVYKKIIGLLFIIFGMFIFGVIL